MPIGRPKKMLNIYILEILKRYTDAEHRFSQKDIQKKLEDEYEMVVDRKAVKSNILDLIQAGYPIGYDTTIRVTPNRSTGEMEKTDIFSDFYIEREFSDAEIRLLIDSVLFSKNIPPKDRNRLIKNLEGLSNVYFKSKVKHIQSLATDKRETNTLFYTIDILDEAISLGKQVKFHYDNYGVDKKLHHRLNSEGNPREYIINPYGLVAANSRYYLICNYDKYDKLSNYRLDRISDIEILDTPVKPKSQVEGLENGLDISKHMAEHIYMFNGTSIHAKFEAPKDLISDILDFFGSDVTFTEKDEETIIVSVKINENDMELWAMQYCTQIKIVEPKSLAEQCKANLRQALKLYKD